MWIVRELLHLVRRVAIAVLAALVVAELRTLAVGGDLVHGFKVSCYVLGVLLVLMAAIGRNNPFERRMDYGITEAAWGRIPGVSTLERHPEDPTLTPGATLASAGIVVLVIAFFV
jgi:hypothetical protein